MTQSSEVTGRHERFSYPDRACAGQDSRHECDLPAGHITRHQCGECGAMFDGGAR